MHCHIPNPSPYTISVSIHEWKPLLLEDQQDELGGCAFSTYVFVCVYMPCPTVLVSAAANPISSGLFLYQQQHHDHNFSSNSRKKKIHLKTCTHSHIQRIHPAVMMATGECWGRGVKRDEG